MGTRCITVVEDEERRMNFVVFLEEFDGYPSIHGDELVAFLARGRVQDSNKDVLMTKVFLEWEMWHRV